MKNNLSVLLIVGGIICHHLKACTIVDPTYDDAFKTLFADSEQSVYNNKTAKDRLIDFLNSILSVKPFGLNIKNLKYLPLSPNAKGNKKIEFDLLCECTCQGKQRIINVEMQRECKEYFIQRMTFYGAKAMVTNFKSANTYDKIPQTIVISILDDYFEEYKDYAAFYIAPSFHNLAVIPEAKNPIAEGTVMDTNLLHICIQLPLIAYCVKENIQADEENKKFVQNLWLQLLASRRICNGKIWDHVDANKVYDMTQNDTLLNLATTDNTCLKSAIKLLQTYATKEAVALGNVEALLTRHIMDENTERMLAQQREQQILEKEQQLQENQKKVAEQEQQLQENQKKVAEQEQQLQENQKNLYRKIVKFDIKKRNKKIKENKKPKSAFKYNHSLKGVDKGYLQDLFSEECLKKPDVSAYFSEYPENPSNSDDYTMDTEDD